MSTDKGLPMTDDEIVRSYQQADDKKKQLKILAELNLCKTDDIVSILKEAGEEVPEKAVRRKRKTFSLEALPEVAVTQSQEDITLTDPEPQVAPAVKNVQETSVYELSLRQAALTTITKMLPPEDCGSVDAVTFVKKVHAVLYFIQEVTGCEH